MTARVEGGEHGLSLRERLEKLRDERMALQNDLDMTCAALSPSSDVPEPDPICNIVNTLEQLYATDAVKVIRLTRETQTTATKMSFNIRRRDMERVRVQELRKILFEIQGLDRNLVRLEGEAERGSLEEVCRLFHSVSSNVTTEDSRVEEGWIIYHQRRTAQGKDLRGRTLDVKDTILRRLAGALHATEILASSDVDETMREAFEMLRLYRWIGESSTGIKTVASLVQKYASRSLETIVSGASTLDFRFAVKTGKVADFVRGLTGWCRAEVGRAGFEADLLQDVMAIIPERILHEGQAALVRLSKMFSQERNLYSTLDSLGRTETARTIDIRELDMLVAELAIMCQNCMSLSLDRHGLLTDNGPTLTMNTMMLFKAISELLAAYCTLEQSYIALGVEKALTLSQVMEEGNTSSCVEDVFFMIRKCCMRAMAIGEEECAIKVLSRSKGLLVSSFIPRLSKRARQLFPDAKSGDSVMIVANDAAAARLCLERIIDEIRELLDAETTLLYSLEKIIDKNDVTVSSSKSRLLNVTVDMEALADGLDKLALTSLETIYSTQVKSKLDPCLFQIIRDLSDPASEDTAALLRLILLLDKSILSQLQSLSEENLIAIVLMMSRAIAMQLEPLLVSLQNCSKERLEGFEMDLRKLISFLASLTELQAKETFSRLIRALTDLEERGDLGKSRSSLNEAQVNSILQSRDIL